MAKIPSPWDDNDDDKGPWADNEITSPKVKQFKPKKPVEIEFKWWWGIVVVLIIRHLFHWYLMHYQRRKTATPCEN